MTTMEPAVDLREPAGWRRSKKPDRHHADGAVVRDRADPARLRPVHGHRQGALGDQLVVPGAAARFPPNVLPIGIGGMWPAIYGTLVITGLAAVIAVPLGVLGAIYVNEYGGPGPAGQVVRFMSDVMTGVPSIVMGLFIFSIWVLHFGYSGLAGAFALACLMLPVVNPFQRGDAEAGAGPAARGQLQPSAPPSPA